MREFWGTLVRFLPDIHTGEVRYAMGHKVFESREQAQDECDRARRENLPFRSWPVRVESPLED